MITQNELQVVFEIIHLYTWREDIKVTAWFAKSSDGSNVVKFRYIVGKYVRNREYTVPEDLLHEIYDTVKYAVKDGHAVRKSVGWEDKKESIESIEEYLPIG